MAIHRPLNSLLTIRSNSQNKARHHCVRRCDRAAFAKKQIYNL